MTVFSIHTFSVDTIVAMEALVRYSYNSRIKDITDLNVEVDIPDSNITMNYYIDGKVSESSLRDGGLSFFWERQ